MRRDPGLFCVVLALVAVVALYATTVTRGLVSLDDPWLVRDNWVVRNASWASIKTIFFDLESPRRFTLAPEYLPIRDLSVMLDYVVWGGWYGGFHLTNLVLYLIAIVMWFQVLVGFGIDRRVAGVALLLWALHPVHAESVAWLSERKGLLGAVFAGAAGLGYVRYRAGRHRAWLILAVIGAVLAVWSKAIAAFSVASLAGLELVLPMRAAGTRRVIGLGAMGLAGIAAFVPVLVVALSARVVGSDVVAPAGRAEMVLGVLGFYVRLGGLAMRNSVSYPISQYGPSAFDLVLGALAACALVWVLVAPKRFRLGPPTVRAAAVIWVAGWLPVSHLILPLQMVFVADRYLLFPSLGLTLLVAYGITTISSTRARRALLAAMCLACGTRTLDAQSTWRDDTTLWQRAIAVNPADGDAWSMYADAAMDNGRMDLAFEVIARGLQTTPSPRLLLRKALFLERVGHHEAALRAMREAAVAGEPRAQSNLALMLLERHEPEEALEWAKRGAERLPMHAPAQRTLGKVALGAGQPALALRHFELAFELEPKNLDNQFNLALALVTLGRADEARPYLEGCRKDPALAPSVRALLDRRELTAPR